MQDNLCEDCGKPFDEHDGVCYQAKSRMEDETLAAEIVDKLSRYANQGRSAKVLVERLSREHRTLQQGMTAIMLQWFVHLASLPANWYDLRNQKSVEVAKAILPVLDAQNVLITRRDKKEACLPCI